MKQIKIIAAVILLALMGGCSKNATPSKSIYFLDVHSVGPGKVTVADAEGAHKKDLAVQGKHGVSFKKYWVDEEQGKIYCLAEAKDSASIYQTHAEAHGLVPQQIKQVFQGELDGDGSKTSNLYLDVHKIGPGNVTAEALAGAHKKDLEVQSKFGVKFINYWFDEKNGVVMCLAESATPGALIESHKAAHGLVPQEVHKVSERK